MSHIVSNLFNIRVYGILITKQNQVLLSDEFVLGKYITKFPGGGLQFGEGTIDCLKREFFEECKMHITVKQHFYTTDFFQLAFHDPTQQVISIYYLVESIDFSNLKLSSKKFDFIPDKEGSQSFRLIGLCNLNSDELTLPIDQHVVKMLNNLSNKKKYYI